MPFDRAKTITVESPEQLAALKSPARPNGTTHIEAAFKPSTPNGSFISRYVHYASQRTDAPPESHELMAAGLLSALAGPSPRIPLATSVSGMHLGLWTLYVVNSTMGRKSSVLDYATDVAREVLGHESIIWWEGSPQGLIQRLQRRDGMTCIFPRDEYSGLLAQVNRGGGHMAGLPQLFIRAYDGRTIENIRTRKRGKNGETEADEDRVENPYLVKLCASTWDAFIERATVDNILDGYLARFVFITGKSNPRRQNRATPALMAERESLIEHARDYHQKAVAADLLDIDDETLNAAFALEQEYLALAEQQARPDAAAPALKRLADSILKVAGLLAIDESIFGETVPIRVDHFRQAQCMGQRWVRSTLAVVDSLGRNDFQKNCTAVLDTVRKKGRATISEVYRAHRRLRAKDIEEVLMHLQTQEEIEVHQDDNSPKAGRPTRRLVYIGKG